MNPLSKNEDGFDFNSETSVDSKEFVVFPNDTIVDFTIVEFKKATTAKDDNMAKLTFRCRNSEGVEIQLRENLVLLRRCEWKINQLFRSVGLRKHGERSVPKWGQLQGSSGRAKLAIEKWEGRDGRVYDVNVIKEYIEPAKEEDDGPLF